VRPNEQTSGHVGPPFEFGAVRPDAVQRRRQPVTNDDVPFVRSTRWTISRPHSLSGDQHLLRVGKTLAASTSISLTGLAHRI
jgi:hypothetical protein